MVTFGNCLLLSGLWQGSTPESVEICSADASSDLFTSARWKAGGLDPPSSPPEICINYTNPLKLWHTLYVLWKQKSELDSHHHNKFYKVHMQMVFQYPYAHKGHHLRCPLLMPKLVLCWILPAPWPFQGTPQSEKINKKKKQLQCGEYKSSILTYPKQMHGKKKSDIENLLGLNFFATYLNVKYRQIYKC